MKRHLNTKKVPYAFWNILIGLYIYALHALWLEDKGTPASLSNITCRRLKTFPKIDRCLTSHGMGFLIEYLVVCLTVCICIDHDICLYIF